MRCFGEADAGQSPVSAAPSPGNRGPRVPALVTPGTAGPRRPRAGRGGPPPTTDTEEGEVSLSGNFRCGQFGEVATRGMASQAHCLAGTPPGARGPRFGSPQHLRCVNAYRHRLRPRTLSGNPGHRQGTQPRPPGHGLHPPLLPELRDRGRLAPGVDRRARARRPGPPAARERAAAVPVRLQRRASGTLGPGAARRDPRALVDQRARRDRRRRAARGTGHPDLPLARRAGREEEDEAGEAPAAAPTPAPHPPGTCHRPPRQRGDRLLRGRGVRADPPRRAAAQHRDRARRRRRRALPQARPGVPARRPAAHRARRPALPRRAARAPRSARSTPCPAPSW